MKDEDDDSDDAPRSGRNKGKSDGNKKEKVRVKRTTEATTLRDQISYTEKMKYTMLAKNWDAIKWAWPRKKRNTRRRSGRRGVPFEARKIALEEQKRRTRGPPRRTGSC